MFLCMFQVSLWLPGIVRDGISFPFDQILQLSSVDSTVLDLLYFIFVRSLNQIGRRFREVGSMCLCLFVRHEKSEVEYIMDLPPSRKGQSVRYWSEDFFYHERAISLGC